MHFVNAFGKLGSLFTLTHRFDYGMSEVINMGRKMRDVRYNDSMTTRGLFERVSGVAPVGRLYALPVCVSIRGSHSLRLNRKTLFRGATCRYR